MRNLTIAILTIFGLWQSLAVAGPTSPCESSLGPEMAVVGHTIEKIRVRMKDADVQNLKRHGLRLAIESLESSNSLEGALGGLFGLSHTIAHFMPYQNETAKIESTRLVGLGAFEGMTIFQEARKELKVEVASKSNPSENNLFKEATEDLERNFDNPRGTKSAKQQEAYERGLRLALHFLKYRGGSFDYALMALNGASRYVNYLAEIERDNATLDELLQIKQAIIAGSESLIAAREKL